MEITSHYLVADPNPGLTPAQIERARKAFIARENARRSTGPITEEGKARSAQNARKHGFAGSTVVLEDEDKAAYAAHLDAYLDSFRPITQAECDQVRKAAQAQWRYDRLLAVETGLLDLELSHRKPTIDAFLDNMEPHHYLAITFQELTNATNALELCRRYMSQAGRETDRAIRTFYLMKKNRPAPEPPPQETPKAQQNQRERNEPTPNRPPTPATSPQTPSTPSANPPQLAIQGPKGGGNA